MVLCDYKLSVGLILDYCIAESKSQLNRALDPTLGRHGAQSLQPQQGRISARWA
jgi:hypothetical protein